jgi:hypothetical protein
MLIVPLRYGARVCTALGAGLVFTMTACGTSMSPAAPPSGTYTLTSIDGRTLPILGAQADTVNGTLEFTGGAVRETIAAQGHSIPGLPVLNTIALGTYAIIQVTPMLVLQPAEGVVPDTAVVAGNVITLGVHRSSLGSVQVRVYVQ